jgi:DNA (cytosine-5)-methyltransferase 1
VKALSLFSGAGGMDLGLDRAGITAVAHCEIDPKAQSVLRRHWPDVPVISDVREVTSDVGRVDLVHGGFPCQDISVAGNRKGLAGDRSGLWWEFHRILGELRPRWCVIENVAGLLSSNGGRDLGSILGALGDLGYGYAYRVLDARFFGVPQRRRRVFIVGHLGGRGAAEVLLEPEGVRRDSATRRETEQGAAGIVAGSLGAGRISRSHTELDGHGSHVVVGSDGIQTPAPLGMIPQHTGTVTCTWAKGPGNTQVEEGHVIPVTVAENVQGDLSPGGIPLNDRTGTLTTRWGGHYDSVQEVRSGAVQPVAFAENQRGDVYLSDYQQALTGGGGKPGQGYPAVLAPTLTAYNLDSRSPQSEEQQRIVGAVHASSLAVRRLTPRECERLMGWPDDWTRWADDGAEIADSHRYRMCGNGVVAPVAEWIGRRIVEVDR